MREYRFRLRKYHPGNKGTCPQCGRRRCFVYYEDSEGEIQFPDNVGRCDHQRKCGYHYTPREYFCDNPDMTYTHDRDHARRNTASAGKGMPGPPAPVAGDQKSFIEKDIMNKTLKCYDSNPLFRFLSPRFGKEETERIFRMYNVGTSRHWGESTIYWYVDSLGLVRTGKVMAYDSVTGHRLKGQAGRDYDHVTWAHSLLGLKDFVMARCLFGEHLLSTSPHKIVMLVESEKSALVGSHYMPQYIWVATGGKDGAFKENVMSVLEGRRVVVVPDLGATEHWANKTSLLRGICSSLKVSHMLEGIATKEERCKGLDIADYLLKASARSEPDESYSQRILENMKRSNPNLEILCKGLDLVLVQE